MNRIQIGKEIRWIKSRINSLSNRIFAIENCIDNMENNENSLAVPRQTQRNEERGLRAYETISLYKERYLGEDGPVNGDEDIVDLLTDIRHFCKQQGIKFSRLVSISYSHFKVETEREE